MFSFMMSNYKRIYIKQRGRSISTVAVTAKDWHDIRLFWLVGVTMSHVKSRFKPNGYLKFYIMPVWFERVTRSRGKNYLLYILSK